MPTNLSLRFFFRRSHDESLGREIRIRSPQWLKQEVETADHLASLGAKAVELIFRALFLNYAGRIFD